MNGMNNSNDDVVECPLCMEPLEIDDLNFYPCTCGYQICRFCWHRIRSDENKLCPACRKEYTENPADFTPLTQEEMIAFKSQKRQRDQQRKHKITENRKHLANVRVVQKNLVFVVGLPPRLADADILKKHEYFGKYGKIHKVVINPSTTYAGVQKGPSASAYVTYVNNNDALRAIQSVNNITIDGRQIKTSLGTTKYCSHFMKNQQCPKGDCMYLHELGDPEASFTKEEMHQGKHQEYEKRLHDALIASAGAGTASGMGVGVNCVATASGATATNGSVSGTTTTQINNNSNNTSSSNNHSSKNGDTKLVNGNLSTASASSLSSSSSSTTSSSSSTSSAASSGTQGKDAWPSLSVSPVNSKESARNGSSRSKKEKTKHEKSKGEKNGKKKNNHNTNNNNHNSNICSNISNSNASNYSSSSVNNKENNHSQSSGKKESFSVATMELSTDSAVAASLIRENGSTSAELDKSNLTDKQRYHENSSPANTDTNVQSYYQQQQSRPELQHAINADEEMKLFKDFEKDTSSISGYEEAHGTAEHVENRSLSSSSSNSSDNTSTLSESTSGKSSPGSFPDHTTASSAADKQNEQQTILDASKDSSSDHSALQQLLSSSSESPSADILVNGIGNGSIIPITTSGSDSIAGSNTVVSPTLTTTTGPIQQKMHTIEQIGSSSNIIDTTTCLSKLNLFDDNNSFFSSSSAASFQQSLLLKGKLENEMRNAQNVHLNSVITSHLPDLLNGIDGYQNNATTTAASSTNEEWEEAFKNLMIKNNKQMEEHLLAQQQKHQQQLQIRHNQQQHPHHQHQQQREEFLRVQDIQKRNNLLNNIGISQMNGPHHDFPNISNNFNGASNELNRLSQTALMQQPQFLQPAERHQQTQQADHLLGSSLFGTNMSKFFDFHKNQQQVHQQQFMVNGHGSSNSGSGPLTDHMRIASLLENNRINSQFLDHSSGLLPPPPQQQLQKQRLLSKYDPMVGGTYNQLMNLNSNSIINQQLQQQHSQHTATASAGQQQQQNPLSNQFSHSSSVDDDLGFDPFIETQKALAELMENEIQQSTNVNSGNSKQQQQQLSQHQQQQQQQSFENMQRTRMPPPGFNHMNAFGFGIPRPPSTSKILPFMNIGVNGQHPNQQQQHMQQPNNWNSHLTGQFQQQPQAQQHPLADPQIHVNQQQNQNGGIHNKGYSNTDWTAMDPAILSFRQFSSFPQQQQINPMTHHPQQQQQQSGPADMFMQHLAQQQPQQNSQGFGPQPQHHGGVNLPNSLLNQQQNSQAQVNFSHSNWLSTEQSLFMNSLTNGFTNNNYDKFSIPIPPGIHQNNLNKQQKTECIN